MRRAMILASALLVGMAASTMAGPIAHVIPLSSALEPIGATPLASAMIPVLGTPTAPALPLGAIEPGLGAAPITAAAPVAALAAPVVAPAAPASPAAPAAPSAIAAAATPKAAGAASRAVDAAPDEATNGVDGSDRIFDGVALEQGRSESLTRTGLLGLSDKIQKVLQLTTRPTYRGMGAPSVFIRGFRRDASGAPILSMAGVDKAHTYSGGVLEDKEGRSYLELPVVVSWSAKSGQGRPANARWRPSGRLEKGRMFPVERLSSAAKTALLRISAEVGRRLKLRFGPSFSGKGDPTVRVTGFWLKNGKPAISIVATQDAFTYSGDPIIMRGGDRLRAVTVSAVVVYDPKTERSEITDVKWLREEDIISRR